MVSQSRRHASGSGLRRQLRVLARTIMRERENSSYLFGMESPIRRAARFFWRAIRLRCPNCGGGPIFWPSPPWTLLQYGGIALMVLAPFVFYPFSKTLFLAFDLLFRPPTRDELS
jgi:hypothetical protein